MCTIPPHYLSHTHTHKFGLVRCFPWNLSPPIHRLSIGQGGHLGLDSPFVFLGACREREQRETEEFKIWWSARRGVIWDAFIITELQKLYRKRGTESQMKRGTQSIVW